MPPSLQESDLIPGHDNTKRTAPTALLFTAAQWQQVLDHLRAALPAEGCGLLACAEDDDGDLTVARIFPGTNTLASPIRYRMEPSEVIDAFRAMREEGLRLAAIFHSHPATPPTLSRIDLREANYPDAALVMSVSPESRPRRRRGPWSGKGTNGLRQKYRFTSGQPDIRVVYACARVLAG